MAGLTAEQIQALLSGGRTKGEYHKALDSFIKSGENGICVNERFPLLADKKPQTLKQGFENVKEGKNPPEGSEHVVVRIAEVDDKKLVYLINLVAAGLVTEDGEPVDTEAVAA